MAIAISKDIARESRTGQLPLKDAVEFLPVVIAQRPDEYDAWARRWLERWITTPEATINNTADIAAALAELPVEPVVALQTLREACR
jgi:hypothetical protein